MMQNIKYGFYVVFVILISGCGGGGSSGTALQDSRFNGEFYYSYYYASQDGINEATLKDTLVFNGSNTADNRRYKKIYNSYSGWTYTGKYIGDWLQRTIEFEIADGKYRYKIVGADRDLSLWGRDSNQWSNWNKYEFNTDGSVLKLYGDYAENAFSYSSIALAKRGVYVPIEGQNNLEVKDLTARQVTVSGDAKEYQITWNLDGLTQIKGISSEINSSNSYSTTMDPLPTSTSLTVNRGETKIFTIQTIDIEGDISAGKSITLQY